MTPIRFDTPEALATTAAFITRGFFDEVYRTAGNAYIHPGDQGWFHEFKQAEGLGEVEAITEVATWAIWLLANVEGALADGTYDRDLPGVFDYEVSEPFGQWYARTIRRTGNAPTRTECADHLETLARDFFTQDWRPDDEDDGEE